MGGRLNHKVNMSKASNNFYNALKDDPKAIVKWCKDEIKEYQKLIKLIEGGVKKLAKKVK